MNKQTWVTGRRFLNHDKYHNKFSQQVNINVFNNEHKEFWFEYIDRGAKTLPNNHEYDADSEWYLIMN